MSGSSEFAVFENATLWREQRRVFDELNLHIHVGEHVAIIGPNGSGKSTLLSAINRQIYPAADGRGEIRLFGRKRINVWQLRRRLGVVAEEIERHYAGRTTVLDTVLSGFFASVGVHGNLRAQLHAQHHSTAVDMLASVGLKGLETRCLDALSSGERRRCFVARALVHSPEALILDEPTSGLDFGARFDLLDTIEGAATETVLFVTHELNVLPRNVQRVILLASGKIVADGPIERIFTRETLSSAYAMDLAVASLNGRYVIQPANS